MPTGSETRHKHDGRRAALTLGQRIFSIPFLTAAVLALLAALAVVVVAGPGADDPPGSTTVPGPQSTEESLIPELTAEQRSVALDIATKDPRVQAILAQAQAGRPEVGVWHLSTGELLGAVVSFEFPKATELTGDWMSFKTKGANAPANLVPTKLVPDSFSYNATYEGVNQVIVSVRLPAQAVVRIEPFGDPEIVGTVPPELQDQLPITPTPGGDQ